MKWDAFSEMSRALNFITLGIMLVACIAIGGLMGHYLDQWLGTKPWLFLLFLFFGIISGFINVFREVFKEAKREEKEDQEKRKRAEEDNKEE